MKGNSKNDLAKKDSMIPIFLIALGFLSLLLLFFINPVFLKLFSPDGVLESETLHRIYRAETLLFALGIVLTAIGIVSRKLNWFEFLYTRTNMTNIILLIITISYFSISSEIILPIVKSRMRIPNKANKARFAEHPFLPYAAAPNEHRILPWHHEFVGADTFQYYTNSYGFLGDEFPKSKDPSTLRILTFGGSTTWAMGVNLNTKWGKMETTWPAILERLLNKSEIKAEVINFALDAATSPISLVNLVLIGLKLKPDIVIDYDGINDAAMFFNYRTKLDYSNIYKDFNSRSTKSVSFLLPNFMFKSVLVCVFVEVIDYSLGYGNQNFFRAIFSEEKNDPKNWYSSEKVRKVFWDPEDLTGMDLFLENYRIMNNICKSEGIQFISSTLHYYERNETRNKINDRLRDFFRDNGIIYFDADLEIPKNDKTINIDQVHFTDKGNTLMAEGFYKIIVEIMQSN